MRFPGSSQPMASVTGIDSLNEGILQHLRQTKRADMHSAIAKIVEKESPAVLSPYLHFQTGDTRDSISTEDGYPGGEPIQVHRIPLRQERGGVPSDIFATTLTPYVWEGGRGLSSLSYLQFDQDQTVRGEGESLPNFLIPIFNRSWNRSDNPLVGLRMTSRLAEQIAKLVAEHRDESHDVQLLAEMSDDGDYYLRVFPAATPK